MKDRIYYMCDDIKIKEECGVFGIAETSACDVASQVYFALYALQHRGQESCGIAVNDRGVITYYRDLGLVYEVFNPERLASLGGGKMAIGHVRYSTTGDVKRSNAQPLVVKHVKGPLALCHNGNITNAYDLRRRFEMNGAIFHGTNDTEVIAYLITNARLETESIEAAVEKAMYDLKGAYSLVVMSAQKLIAARDPIGFRPLCIGRTKSGGYVVASESCALDSIGAKFIRDIDPGEIVVIKDGEIKSIRTHCADKKPHICVFEYIYIARPDSVIQGASVHEARLRAGEFLAKSHPVEADVVIGVPDSGLDAALGYSRASGIPYGVGFIKNRYVGRSFIQPTQEMRDNAVRIKLNVLKSVVDGKRVIMIDDSIVRGTTSARIVRLLRNAGATEVHVRVSSPPFTNPCYFGVDIDSREKLIACRRTLDEICKDIGADSLEYLSIDDVRRIADTESCDFCDGCFTGNYPCDVPEQVSKSKFETKIQEQLEFS